MAKAAKKQEFKKLSPSRIETLNTCSWSYYANYNLNLPNAANSGSGTGSALHNLFETTLKNRKRHEWKVNKIIKDGTIKVVPSVDRYLKILCAKEGYPYDLQIVNKDKSAMISVEDYVDPMAVTGFKTEFYGEEGEEFIAEQDHEIDYHDKKNGIRFIVRGFIDKMFLKKGENGAVERVRICDYKSSKQKFSPEKMTSNVQALIYQMFAHDLYPKAKKVTMRFIFLQFAKNPHLDALQVSPEIIKGFRYHLSDLFKKINNFGEKDAYENFAKDNGGHFLCGGERGFQEIKDKKTGQKTVTSQPKWQCPHKDPYDFYVLSDKDGKVLKSVRDQEDLKPSEEQKGALMMGDLKIEKRHYTGCPAWHQQN